MHLLYNDLVRCKALSRICKGILLSSAETAHNTLIIRKEWNVGLTGLRNHPAGGWKDFIWSLGSLPSPHRKCRILTSDHCQGTFAGPCFWLTAGIHGPEHGGPVVIYRLLTQELLDQLHGTIIAIPALNPIGLRTMERQPPILPKDPNRLWPDGKPRPADDPDVDPPSPFEVVYERLFAEIVRTADFMIDYHNSWTGSLSFSFQDRILYRDDEHSAANRAEADGLHVLQHEMLRAYGHTIVGELPADKLIRRRVAPGYHSLGTLRQEDPNHDRRARHRSPA